MRHPIAIVGRGCALPGALDPASLWRMVAAGEHALGAPPEGRLGLDVERVLVRAGEPSDDRASSLVGGFVRAFEGTFDPSGFAIEAELIASLGPVFQWPLYAAREALAEAGGRWGGRRAATVLGNLAFPTREHAAFAEAHWLEDASARALPAPHPLNRFHAGLPARLVTLALGLEDGGSFCLDAACASGLYALAHGADMLAEGEVDLVLAGGVSATDALFLHVGFTALGALSPSGRSRPFAADADGLLPGEGAGVLALMRLEDALEEGRAILGVLRGIGLSNDGRARGPLAPDGAGQRRAMRAAYEDAGLAPEEICLLECHATGTVVGDGAELESAREIFGAAKDLVIGSLKANVGHLLTAAGAAGVLKVLGAFEHGLRPPSPKIGRAHPMLEDAPFRILDEAEPWPEHAPRRAAVSAFGFGGNDAHLIVEAFDPTMTRPSRRPRALAPLALIGLEARVADLEDAAALESSLETDEPRVRARGRGRESGHAAEVTMRLEGLKVAPADLGASLAQQTMLLAAARELEGLALPREGTGVFVGMQCDSEVARFGARVRLETRAAELGASEAWAAGAKEAFASALNASTVLGRMPNLVANRVNHQLDLGGASHVVSAEERSGLVALACAARALRRGQLDAAIVGAVDLSSEGVHESAADAILPATRRTSGDAAVVLALARLDDAEAKGLPVLATLEGVGFEPRSLAGTVAEGERTIDLDEVAHRFGHAHAASGLVALALAALDRRGPDPARVLVDGIGGPGWVTLTRRALGRREAPEPGRALTLPAHPEPPALPSADGAETMWAAPRRVGTMPIGIRPDLEGPAVMLPPSVKPGIDRRHATKTARSPVASPRTEPTPRTRPDAARRSGDGSSAAPSAPNGRSGGAAAVTALREAQSLIAEAHRAFLARQQEIHLRFLEGQARAWDRTVTSTRRASTPPVPRERVREIPATADGDFQQARPPVEEPAPPTRTRAPAPAPAIEPTLAEFEAEPTPRGASPGRGLVAASPPPTPRGPSFDRAALEVHAKGKISEIFGPAFAPQDPHAVQCRMPTPPLLLADRVTGLDAEPASMGTGSIWTETDVRAESWYLHQGRMPAGLMIEAGQADLFLISWLGADLELEGTRRYRLLGCQLTWHRAPPKVGETLGYDIHIDGHAAHGDTRLFFFHYDCHIGDEPALTVRGGQAGFFTEAELAASAGILFRAEDDPVEARERLDPPPIRTQRASLGRAELEAFAAGDVFACFGPGFEPAAAEVQSPCIARGDLLLLDEVTHLELAGGPHGRGYLRARTAISPSDWFFTGHFHNDPCMPGTLMLEGCFQAMAIYLSALGFGLGKDGWRFRPIPGETYDMRCRGQVVPSSEELTYEVFVRSVEAGPTPRLYADLYCEVDGLGAFLARRLGLELVPDIPEVARAPGASPEEVAALETEGGVLPLDGAAMLASARGWPSEAFGPGYARFDGSARAPRLPGPPYAFMDRVTSLSGEPFVAEPGMSVEAAWDIPPDGWHIGDGASGTVPFAVLLEAALQPCGWLASYSGAALRAPTEVRFRNLDGEGVVFSEIASGTLRTRATLTKVTETPAMSLVSFDIDCRLCRGPREQEGERVARFETSFGFFPDAAFASQAGLPVDDAQRALRAGHREGERARTARARIGRLAWIETLPLLDPTGGRAGLGAARGERLVSAADWYFAAHFYQDPVQPGSLGTEAMLELLEALMLEAGLDEGMRRPRFQPIALEGPIRWKYRGQVRPSDERAAVTLEITGVEREPGAVVARADASLWLDERRIYEASIAARLVAGAEIDVRPHWPRDGRADREALRRFWRDRLEAGESAAEEVALALTDRLLGGLHLEDADALDALGERPTLYLANHQTAIETLLASLVIGASTGRAAVTVAKAEHQESWYGRLLRWLVSRPGAQDPRLIAFLDRNDPSALPALLDALAARESSVLIHAEGTRAASAGARLGPISGVPIEYAIAQGMPIVPMRFFGTLPRAPARERLDFPLGLASARLFIGRPIEGASLEGAAYKEKVARVRQAIESLGEGDERPEPPARAFVAAVEDRRREGTKFPRAVVHEALRSLRDPNPEAARLLEILDGRAASDDPIERWLAGLGTALDPD